MTIEVIHPSHYNKHPSGLECWDVVERLSFNLGNAVKYLWRADEKGQRAADLAKVEQYLLRVLQPENLSREFHGPDATLGRAVRLLLHHGGWNAMGITHLLQASLLGSPTHVKVTLNHVQFLRAHPRETREAPQPYMEH